MTEAPSVHLEETPSNIDENETITKSTYMIQQDIDHTNKELTECDQNQIEKGSIKTENVTGKPLNMIPRLQLNKYGTNHN